MLLSLGVLDVDTQKPLYKNTVIFIQMSYEYVFSGPLTKDGGKWGLVPIRKDLMYEWYVLYCNNQDVERITQRVKGLNVEVFYPRYIKVTPRRDCRAVRQEEKPLFPSYLFLRLDVNVTHTSTITSIPGAHGFVSFGSAPCTVPESVITAIKCARLMALNSDEDVFECRNISPGLLLKIQELSHIRTPLQRQVAFSRLLQNQ